MTALNYPIMARCLLVEEKFDLFPRYEEMNLPKETTIADLLNEKLNLPWGAEKHELETTVREITLPTTDRSQTALPLPLAEIVDILRATAKIELTDDSRTISNKTLEIPFYETHTGYSTSNPALDILRTIIIPLSQLHIDHKLRNVSECEVDFAADPFTTLDAPEGTLFTIEVAIWCFGECVNKHYRNYEEIESDWGLGRMGEEDLKLAVARSLCCVLEWLRGRL